MGKVVLDMSMSLDGFIRAANPRPEEPLGEGGGRLHDWVTGGEANRKVLEGAVANLGATIAGRRTYDDSVPWWGADGPSGPARRPLFVVTHAVPANIPENSVYEFATGGIEDALARAQAVGGDKPVAIMGGANIAQQYLAAGLVDELSIHLVPVLFGSGTRLFEGLGSKHIDLEPLEAISNPEATHLRFCIVK